MKIKGVYLLVQLEDDNIHQAILTEDQEMAIKSMLSMLNDTIMVFEKPLELETFKPEIK